ncbi:hypothetical protein DBR06_SOUSAS11010010, partial [Sousa chinensis]
SYQSQFISHERKAHGNRLRAPLVERNLNNLRRGVHWTKFIAEVVKHFEKYTYVLDIGNGAFGRSLQRSSRNPLDGQITKKEWTSNDD